MKITVPYIAVSILIAVALLWLAFGYFGVQALFTNTTVNETLPITENNTSPATDTPPQAASITTASSSVQLIATGDFMQGDSTYTIKGTAHVVTQNDTRTLVLSDFDVTNGPDLFVYLVAASSTENNHLKQQTTQGHFIQLAALKGNRGNQNYILPADIDLSTYPVVSIWCRRFSRNFGSALLRAE
jgi:hypothetical protein